MRVLVTGASGQLAQAIRLVWAEHELVLPEEPVLDLGKQEAIRSVVAGARPDVVVNCGAFTQVDRCETEAELARLINATAVGWLAEACEAQGAMLIQISTDYVFDGTGTRPYREVDPVNPVSVYGRTKLEGRTSGRALFPAPDCPHQLALRCLGQELPQQHAGCRSPGENPASGG